MPAYVPPHLRKQQQQQQQQQQQGSAAVAGRSLAELDQAASASESARWGRAAALGAGATGSRWAARGTGGSSGSYSNNRSREDRSYEYRSDNAAPCVHPTGEQGGVGECFGTVVRREASEHPVLSGRDVAKIAAAAAAATREATSDEEHDGEKGSEEPFFDAFLTGAVRDHPVSDSLFGQTI